MGNWLATADAGADMIEIYWRQGGRERDPARSSKAPTPWSLKQTINVAARGISGGSVKITSLSFNADSQALLAVVESEDPNKPHEYTRILDTWIAKH